MAALTMDDLKTWVGDVKQRTEYIAEGTVLLDLTHNYLKNQFVEIPFEESWTVRRCKEKLYTTFGTSPENMILSINGVPMPDDNALLSSFGVKHGMVIHCIDTDPTSAAKGGGLEDVSLVKKYEMTDEDYDKRENTYRAYKRKMLAKDPNWVPKHVAEARARKAEEDALKPKTDQALLETLDQANSRMKVGDRCEAIGGRRGEIKYIGLVPEIKTNDDIEDVVWVGVEYDEAEGKNDGSIKGKRYFQAGATRGAFLKSHLVKAGDYPELDPFASDDEEDLMEEL